MKRRRHNELSSRFLLGILLTLCIIILFASYSTGFNGGVLSSAASSIFHPMQKGIDYIGSKLSVNSEDAKSKNDLIKENSDLKSQLQDARNQISQMQIGRASCRERV